MLSAKGLLMLRVAVFAACLVPLALLVGDAVTGDLTANPVEEITHRTGWWALALLIVTLAVTPIRRITGWNRVIRLRRMLGLFSFFYATLHLLTYVALDQFFAFEYVLEDIAERPYITVGFAAWLILAALAATSTRGWVRRLGRRWQRLHRLVYPAAALAVLHFLWLVKADLREPLIFALVLAALLAVRLIPRQPPRARAPDPRPLTPET